MSDQGRGRSHPKIYGVWDLLKDTYKEWSLDNAPQLGAALAFYTIFSLAPILIIITAVVGFFLGKDSVQIHILTELTKVVGQENATNIMAIIQNRWQPGSGITATIIAILLMLIGSTTIFVMLKNALNTMWGVKVTGTGIKSILKERLLSFVIVLCVGTMLLLSMITSSVLAAMGRLLGNFFTIPIFFYQSLDCVFSIILLTGMFAMLYKFLPDVEISWGDVWVGAVITAILFTIGKYLLGLYLTRGTVSSAYGAAGSFVVFLLWVYYSAQIIFIGAEFTQVYARKYGTAIVPKKY